MTINLKSLIYFYKIKPTIYKKKQLKKKYFLFLFLTIKYLKSNNYIYSFLVFIDLINSKIEINKFSFK